jgi:hypothetical protein
MREPINHQARAEIAQLTAAYLAQGGTIEQIPTHGAVDAIPEKEREAMKWRAEGENKKAAIRRKKILEVAE